MSCELTFEQKFNVEAYRTRIQSLSEQEAKQALLALYTDHLIRENYYRQLLKEQWGIG